MAWLAGIAMIPARHDSRTMRSFLGNLKGFEIMATAHSLFTLKEAAYLQSLPAVKHVTATRITYEDSFKIECIRRYLRGESARKIFREAGLMPSLIGDKRIERCVARWKTTKSIVDAAVRHNTVAESTRIGLAGGQEATEATNMQALLDSYDIANAAFAAVSDNKRKRDMFDVRDLIIYQQAQQIRILQDYIARMQGDTLQQNGELQQGETSLAEWNTAKPLFSRGGGFYLRRLVLDAQ